MKLLMTTIMTTIPVDCSTSTMLKNVRNVYFPHDTLVTQATYGWYVKPNIFQNSQTFILKGKSLLLWTLSGVKDLYQTLCFHMYCSEWEFGTTLDA